MSEMRKLLLFPAILFSSSLLWAGDDLYLPENYFFPPPKSLYYFRPDLYVYRITPEAYPYRRPMFGYRGPSRYTPPPAYGYLALEAAREARSAGEGKIYRLFLDSPPSGGVIQVNSSDLIFNVSPVRALVFIDGKLIGSAGDFASHRNRYMILDGDHTLRIEHPGYQPFVTTLSVVANKTLHLDIELERQPRSR